MKFILSIGFNYQTAKECYEKILNRMRGIEKNGGRECSFIVLSRVLIIVFREFK
jgi:hypothetical protein